MTNFFVVHRFIWPLPFFILTSCVSFSGSYVERKRVNHSVEAIFKAYDKASPGLRGKSANGRELVSKYHAVNGDIYDNAYNKKERAYSKLSILGDRRPYVLRVQVVIEERMDDGTYEVVDHDDEAAQKILDKIVEFLVTRPDKDDFIDDYRAF